MKTVTRITQSVAALALVSMTACSMQVQAPIQTQQQQQPPHTFVEQLRQAITGHPQESAVPQAHPWDTQAIQAPPAGIVGDPGDWKYQPVLPAPLPKVVWPALGAGDYLLPQAQPQRLVGPVVGPSASLLPALRWSAASGEFDMPQRDIKVEGPVDDCPIRPLRGPC